MLGAEDQCRICGQYTIGRIDPAGRCDTCQREDRKPQGEQERLFQPAPVQMPGQTWIGDSAEGYADEGRPLEVMG